MNHVLRSFLATLVAFAALLVLGPGTSAVAQELPPPQPSPLECATGVSTQLLSAIPINDGRQTLLLARGILDPGAHIGAHRNLGTGTVVVESGSFGFTLLDDVEMTITRAATADTEATEEPVVVGKEVTLNPGDALAPPAGTTHVGRNLSDGETTVLLAGLIETGQPPEECVDAATPAA